MSNGAMGNEWRLAGSGLPGDDATRIGAGGFEDLVDEVGEFARAGKYTPPVLVYLHAVVLERDNDNQDRRQGLDQ